MTDCHHILLNHENGVATLTLNEPATLNAASFAMAIEMRDGLKGPCGAAPGR